MRIMVNKVILVGNLGRDPEMGVTTSERQWARFSLATNRRWNDRDGNKQEETEWHQVTCWGKLAEIVGQYLHKGKPVYVEGRLRTSSWEDKNTGEKKYRTEVVCERMQMLGGGNGNGAPPPSDEDYGGDTDPDDIPF
jgi:single-strand DNA-binding protein